MFSEGLFSSWLLDPMHLVWVLWIQNYLGEDSLFLHGQTENESERQERNEEHGTQETYSWRPALSK